ncbi:hypothetical protein NIES2100_02990 [Calothrix sp. NIES-2100]|nr:hypothetical protein NIES2100_02990 [Calothrix sp. NIES-2100]
MTGILAFMTWSFPSTLADTGHECEFILSFYQPTPD